MLARCVLLCAALGVHWGTLAFADSGGFRCPGTGRLISKGDSTDQVVARCREPDASSQHREQRTVRQRVRRWLRGVLVEVEEERSVEVIVDRWTYDFGKERFVRHLLFENDRLVSIRDGARGNGPSEP